MATNESIIQFIETLGNLAVAEANRRAAAGGKFVVPSICIAQSAHETGWGDSDIMTKANAFFGIKAGGSWTGKIFTADTREVAPNGESYNISANFRAYDSLADSVRDYYDLIVNNARYAAGLSTIDNMLSPYDTIYAIWSGGYATDPPYVQMIMDIVNGRDLEQWDAKIDGVTGVGGSPNIDYTEPLPVAEGSEVRFVFEKI